MRESYEKQEQAELNDRMAMDDSLAYQNEINQIEELIFKETQNYSHMKGEHWGFMLRQMLIGKFRLKFLLRFNQWWAIESRN